MRAMKSSPEVFQKIKGEFDRIVEESSNRYHPLVYHFDEDLLSKMNDEEKWLRDGAKPAGSEPQRWIPEIDKKEEDDHFRETIRRWSEKTGRNFREALDELTRARAQVDPKEPFHPAFHKQFGSVFDDFIAIEVAEMRERRNRAIHKRLRGALDPHRTELPLIAAHFEALIAVPPYQWKGSAVPPAGAEKSTSR